MNTDAVWIDDALWLVGMLATWCVLKFGLRWYEKREMYPPNMIILTIFGLAGSLLSTKLSIDWLLTIIAWQMLREAYWQWRERDLELLFVGIGLMVSDRWTNSKKR